VGRAALAFAAVALAFAGCGGGGGTSSSETGASSSVPGSADTADVQVIQGWVAALDRNDIEAAAGYFALPSTAQNGLLFHIRTAEQARAFNRSLPCGARVVRATTLGNVTTATFRLTERPGPGLCGLGTGGKAKTSFVISDGKITQWRRVGAGSGTPQAPSSAA
jgi:hypothetical protein